MATINDKHNALSVRVSALKKQIAKINRKSGVFWQKMREAEEEIAEIELSTDGATCLRCKDYEDLVIEVSDCGERCAETTEIRSEKLEDSNKHLRSFSAFGASFLTARLAIGLTRLLFGQDIEESN